MVSIETPIEFERIARSRVKFQLKRNLNDSLLESFPFVTEFLARRYIECINYNSLLSREVFSDYLLEEEKEDLNLAAISCEMWGSFFDKHLESKNSFISLKDIANGLSFAYDKLSQKNTCFYGLAEESLNILDSFRETTSIIKQYKTSSNIITLH